MLIPADCMVPYVTKMADSQFPFPILTPNGGVAFTTSRESLLEMCDLGTVIATGSRARIKRIQVCYPNPKRMTLRQRQMRKAMLRSCPIVSQAGRTIIHEALPIVVGHVWTHHTGRCTAWPH
jgi:hypothetical protein